MFTFVFNSCTCYVQGNALLLQSHFATGLKATKDFSYRGVKGLSREQGKDCQGLLRTVKLLQTSRVLMAELTLFLQYYYLLFITNNNNN